LTFLKQKTPPQNMCKCCCIVTLTGRKRWTQSLYCGETSGCWVYKSTISFTEGLVCRSETWWTCMAYSRHRGQ